MRNLIQRHWSRRAWLARVGMAAVWAPTFRGLAESRQPARSFHLCLSPVVVEGNPELVDLVARAGVRTVWLAGFFYGHRPYDDDLLRRARLRLERAGLEAQLITVPLGHPGDSLGATDGGFPLTPPEHWQTGQRPDGTVFAGTSLHPPATEENQAALRHLRGQGFSQCFLDDDFRLARSPGEIGGCFCGAHRTRFLQAGGYDPGRWDELREAVQTRSRTPLLRAWLDFTCDELSASFRAQERAFRGDLGIMVMYLGAEKAGIRLRDYRTALFRVGELMFDDGSFGTPKGKTDELFSALFHRRFAAPERCYSETTAFPADRLSAANMAAKLVISTLADVRHTMFMSGLTPFPREHWDVLAPAMRRQADLHEQLAGHRPRGPFKHFWGDAERQVGEDRPFSLWLALGVPFEVIDRPSTEGWTFLSDFDARAEATRSRRGKSHWVCRPSTASSTASPSLGTETVPETLADLFAFKRRIRDQLGEVPYVAEDEPAVCAWYPSARKIVVWNLVEETRTLTLVQGTRRSTARVGPLETWVTDVT